MAFYTVVPLYEYAVLCFLAVARTWALLHGGTQADMALIATGVFHAQGLLLALVVGALVARIIQYAFGPQNVPLVYEFIGGVGDVAFPDNDDDLWKSEQVHPKALQQVSGTRRYVMLLNASRQGTHFRPQECSSLFAILPAEVRQMVYRWLLVASEFDNPSQLVNEKMRSLIVPASHPRLIILSIDATALRTCRRIYEEALPILYGDNTYKFSTASSLETFKGEGLIRTACKDSLCRNSAVQ